jgi:hypothetical protein
MRYARLLVGVAAMLILVPASASAQDTERIGAAGYFRVGARPDFQGGTSQLGYWNLYGRLLNEGPYALLEMRLDIVEPDPLGNTPWTSVHARVEGGSAPNAGFRNGSLEAFRLSQLYARAGNVLFEDVTFQFGTIDYFIGDLGLYDFRPSQLFFETIGAFAQYESGMVDWLVGVGDSGYFIKGDQYNTILTAGTSLRLRPSNHFEFALGGQFMHEPKVEGNRNAPHVSRFQDGTGINYENWVRGEVVQRYDQANPGRLDEFADPEPVSASSFKAIAYMGFGGFGPLLWNNLFANFMRLHPETFTTEEYLGEEYTIYVTDLTDERYQFNIGNEAQIRLIPGMLDLVWSGYLGYHFNLDNEVAAGEDNRLFYSTVARLQGYATDDLHLLLESSLAREISLNGNFYRSAADSVFRSTNGQSDSRGLEFGDLDTRETFQIKGGPVLSPLGMGVFTRPQFRLLYGAQLSNQNNAFGNAFVDSLSDFNDFGTQEQYWHHVVSLEVEAWF